MSVPEPTSMADFRVFYSWQSDISRNKGQDLIRRAIDSAAKALNAKSTTHVLYVDEATRDEPGSPDILATILEKIAKADAFIGDVSTIGQSANGTRALQNPNVLVELGYAVAQLGYPRIIVVCNCQFTSFPDDLPFDIERRRVTKFAEAHPGPAIPAQEAELAKKLEAALALIMSSNPSRARDLLTQNPERLWRERDIDLLREVLSRVHGPSLLSHAEDMPYKIDQGTMNYWYDFDGWVNAKVHLLHDPGLRANIALVHQQWNGTLEHSLDYHATASSKYAIFDNPGDRPLSDAQQAHWDSIQACAVKLRGGWVQLCEYARDKYPEVDIDGCSRAAFQALQDYLRKVDKDENALMSKVTGAARKLLGPR